jgi:uncharacterized protein involved in exopolysaccharide biosynthesis
MQEIFAQVLLFLRGAWRYRWPALALTWVVAIVGWLVVAMIPDEFESRTQVYVDTESLLKPLLKDIAVQRDIGSQVAMMQAVMLSRPNLEKVARQTDLFLDAPTRLQQEGHRRTGRKGRSHQQCIPRRARTRRPGGYVQRFVCGQ